MTTQFGGQPTMVNFVRRPPRAFSMTVSAPAPHRSASQTSLSICARENSAVTGIRLKLPGQPFAVLAMLLEHPGEVVTREELHAHLWQKETFVDFDHSLNVAINKLRETLCDSADNRGSSKRFHELGTDSSDQSPNPPLRSKKRSGKEIQRAPQKQKRPEPERTFERAGGWSSLLPWLCRRSYWLVTSISIAHQNSLTKTRSSLPTSRTPRAIRSLTTRCGKVWRCNLSSRLSSASSQTTASSSIEADGQASRCTTDPGDRP